MSSAYLNLTKNYSFRPERVSFLSILSKLVGLQAMSVAPAALTRVSAWRVALTSNFSNLCSGCKYSDCTSRTLVRLSAFDFPGMKLRLSHYSVL